MASEVDIANLALSRVGVAAISSLNDPTREAEVCRVHYTNARDSGLRDFDWAFARRWASSLPLLELEHPAFDYSYELPADLLAARRIVNPTDPQGRDPRSRIAFEVSYVAGSTNKNCLFTDYEDPTVVYTAKVTTSAAFDALFVDALAWRLAVDLALPLRGDERLMTSLNNAYRIAGARAAAESLNEQILKPDGAGEFVAARQ
jgi:hypothetical protein